METENTRPENPRMHNPDGVYASEARLEDYFSLRDHFAGLAMQTLLGFKHYDGQQMYNLNCQSSLPMDHFGEGHTEQDEINAKESVLKQALHIAEMAHIMANAMLLQRQNQ